MRMRVEAAYRRGAVQAALAIATRATTAYTPESRSRARSTAIAESSAEKLRTLAERLRAATPESRRIVLDIPFVRQEHLGCAPATLASLSRYFGIPADHVELADRMCYHGTPAHAERSWAESHGFVAREMRLTWEVAVSLPRRGIPFHLSTFVPGSGHAQAVMGIDERRGSIILRDPSIPLPIEVDAAAFLEAYRHCVPRCLVLVPTARASELDGVDLPDAELYDELYEVERALAAHDRPRAAAACARLVERAAQHRVARMARRALAAYDDDPFAIRAIAEEALAADADDQLARLDLVSAEQVIAPRARRLDVLEEAVRTKRAPIFLELLSTELSTDAREHSRAKKLARIERYVSSLSASLRMVATDVPGSRLVARRAMTWRTSSSRKPSERRPRAAVSNDAAWPAAAFCRCTSATAEFSRCTWAGGAYFRCRKWIRASMYSRPKTCSACR